MVIVRDRPFNLKGERGRGGYGFLFGAKFFFRTTQELEYLFFLSNFFPEFNIQLYDKKSESDYIFFLHQNQNIFFSNIGNQNIFLEKNHNPLQVKWSFPQVHSKLNDQKNRIIQKYSSHDHHERIIVGFTPANSICAHLGLRVRLDTTW